MTPRKITNSIMDGLTFRSAISILVIVFSLGGMQWQFVDHSNKISELMKYKDAHTKVQEEQFKSINSSFDETQSLIIKSSNILSVRTNDRWTKTDDEAFMKDFSRINNLVMTEHKKITPEDPEIN